MNMKMTFNFYKVELCPSYETERAGRPRDITQKNESERDAKSRNWLEG
jgi:hypothetical protein